MKSARATSSRSACESTSVPSRSKATCSYTTPAATVTARRSDGERRAGSARVARLEVRELEPATVQTAHEIDLGFRQVLGARRVDEHTHAVVLEDAVVVARSVVEVELVAEARAATADHRDAKCARLGEAFAGTKLLHLLHRTGGEREGCGVLGCSALGHTRTIGPACRKVNEMRALARSAQRACRFSGSCGFARQRLAELHAGRAGGWHIRCSGERGPDPCVPSHCISPLAHAATARAPRRSRPSRAPRRSSRSAGCC